jgi:hypothetical protein
MSNYVKHNKSTSKAEALQGAENTIYFTTDTQEIVVDGKIYGGISSLITPISYADLVSLVEGH